LLGFQTDGKEVIENMKSTNNVLTLSDKELSSLVAEIDRIATVLAEGSEALDPKQASAMVKLSGKRVRVIPSITSLAGKYGISSPSSPVADINADLAAATKLRGVLESIEGLRKVVFDQVLISEGNSWKGAATLYGSLQSEARRNPALKLALKPVSDQLRVPRKKGTEQTSQTANATGTAGTTSATQSSTTAPTKSPT
jgi:hypothetical protein